MKRIKLVAATFLLFALLYRVDSAVAQMVFSASASAPRMGLQDQIQFTYSLQNPGDIKEVGPEGSTFRDFEIVAGPSQSSSSNISVINGHMQRSETVNITYVVRPKRTGTLILPAGIAKDGNGHAYTSNSVQVEVVKGSLAPQQRSNDPFDDQDPFAAIRQMQQQMMRRQQQMQQQMQQQQPSQPQAQQPTKKEDLGKNLFIKVVVDKNKVRVGEQVTAMYKLYTRLPMNMQISKLPSLNGFWTQDFELPKDQKPAEETINGVQYQVFTLKKSALFPQESGQLTLDPAEADGVARILQKTQSRNPFADDPFFQAFGGSLAMNDPFFDNGAFSSMSYQDVPVNLKSTPVKISVTPLPTEGKPQNYGGAVGSFSVSAQIPQHEFTTDDAANLTLTITGSGNLKLIQPPVLSLPNGVESYDPTVIDTITGRTTTISGSKIITYPLSFQTPGDYELPPIEFSYFNPQTNSYTTLHTQPMKIHVKQGKGYKADADRTKLADLKDIHDINTNATQITPQSKPLLFTVGYWSMYGAPLLAFIGMAFYRRREEELSKDVIKLRNRRANKVALKRLKTARKFLAEKQQKPFYEEVSKAIWLYLSDKLNIPLAELSRERAEEIMKSRNVPDELMKQTEFVIQECETALYAPAGGTQQMQKVYEEAIAVLSNLEDKM